MERRRTGPIRIDLDEPVDEPRIEIRLPEMRDADVRQDDRIGSAQDDGYHAELAWRSTLVRAAVLVDLAAILLPTWTLLAVNAFNAHARRPSLTLGLILPLIWLVAMNLSRAQEARFLGHGSEEFKRVLDAAIRVAALVASISYGLHANISRGLIIVAIPTGTVLNLLGRYAVRKWLHRQRRAGRCGYRVLLVGAPAPVTELASSLRRAPYAGMEVVGCCLSDPSSPMRDLPVFGDYRDIMAVIHREGVTAVAVASSEAMDSATLRRLNWGLEGTGVEVLVAPNLTDLVGPRIHIRPLAGLPLLHIEEPELSGGHRLLKSLVDRSLALVALVILSPLLLAVGLAVRCTSPGPAFFRQVRTGCGGKEFRLFKFRTMHVDAEARLAELMEFNESADGLLFKMRRDPRITKIGGLLRRYSLDELPQLINVLRGDMSLVGPRPPLPSEVERYESDVRRRLLVAPGLTGLWQISGRSDLSWQESVRLDLYYVENWSLALDVMILWKTVPAVLRGTGAY